MTTDDQPAPSIADILRYHGITPCARCAGEGVLKAKTDLLEQTAACGRCDGTGEEPKGVEHPDGRNNVSMDRAKPRVADVKGQSK